MANVVLVGEAEAQQSEADGLRELYLVSEVIFVEIKNGKITDKRGVEISTDFIIEREHYLGNGWGYVII